MVKKIKRPFVSFMGAFGYKLYFDTWVYIIKSGWIQSLGESRCYRKLPGGQIYIFGYGDLTTNASGTATQTITLPIAFPNEFVSLTDGIYEIGDSTWTVGQLILMKVGLSQVKIVINDAAPNKIFRVSFEAKGY